jgi:23S rRNA (uridine2552-2'-O)-methyltransferase
MPQPRKLHDRFFKQAKAEGYVARSAYKLLEINEGKRIVREHNRVIDLGCAPGSWLQVVENIIGPSGLAVGIDLQEVRPMFGPTITTIVGDAFTIDPALLLSHIRGKPADALISDMAPNTTGHGDDFMSARLCRRVLELAPRVLRPGGSLLMKVLEGADMPDLIKETRALFAGSGATKPAASRDVSREIFIWAYGFNGPKTPPAAPSTPTKPATTPTSPSTPTGPTTNQGPKEGPNVAPGPR